MTHQAPATPHGAYPRSVSSANRALVEPFAPLGDVAFTAVLGL